MIHKLTHAEILAAKPSPEKVRGLEKMPFYAILDNIRSLYNVGAIFRTCDGILAEKIYLCGITGKPPRKEIAKAALGAVETVEWTYSPSVRETLLKLKEKGVKIYALELCRESVDYKAFKYEFPMALVVGNEVSGVSDNVMDLVDGAVAIPMKGRANSLNVATAFGIAAYEIASRWGRRDQ